MRVTDYAEIVDSFRKIMVENSDISDIKPGSDKWSLSEMVGHLIDSASNNHQRFLRLQISDNLIFPAYDAENWKKISKTNSFDYVVLIELWYSFNLYLLFIVSNIDEKNLLNVWQIEDSKLSLGFLVGDYYRHMKVHYDLFVSRSNEIRKDQ